jgi:peptidoglycan hydrolase-like protein with peptidoglycan-binding domain
MLHMLLEGFGFGRDIVPDLEYGDVTSERVADLQLYLLEVEPDGHFGQATRAALKAKTGFDVDAISWAPQNGLTYWLGHDGQLGVWPE